MADQPVFNVSDFVAVFNQTLEFAYPRVTIVGELSNFKVSKNRWVYFDLKDDFSSVRFFGSIYSLPGPLENGMMLQVSGSPRLHQQFGFSVTAQTITPVGEGSIKKAADLLKIKLAKEGLFDVERKRPLPYPPKIIGLITSGESAAYADFVKILSARWGGIEILHKDVQVQGEAAPSQISQALSSLNQQSSIEAIIIIRGGGSKDDLAAFDNEMVVRAIAGSRIPTLVAIGHEVDLSLSELAADKHASTPSNAAELLVPDKQEIDRQIQQDIVHLKSSVLSIFLDHQKTIMHDVELLHNQTLQAIKDSFSDLNLKMQLLKSFDPRSILKQGYAQLFNMSGKRIKSIDSLKIDDQINIQLLDGSAQAKVIKLDRI